MRPLAAAELLTAWEQGRGRHPLDRAVLLHALASPEAEPDTLADQPLGRRNAALLALRQATFGDRLSAYLDCPECGERLEFEQSASALLNAQAPTDGSLEVDGIHFRLPTSRDMAQAIGKTDVEAMALDLLKRCIQQSDRSMDDVVDLTALIDRVEAAMERADPLAELAFEFVCELCGHAWASSFDVAGYLWEEIETQAMRLLDEVHGLALAYGWRESEILALSPVRRAAYLARVAA